MRLDSRAAAHYPVPAGPCDLHAIEPARKDADRRHRPLAMELVAVQFQHVLHAVWTRSLDEDESHDH